MITRLTRDQKNLGGCYAIENNKESKISLYTSPITTKVDLRPKRCTIRSKHASFPKIDIYT